MKLKLMVAELHKVAATEHDFIVLVVDQNMRLSELISQG